MAQDNTADTINSLAKEVYASGVENLVPDDTYLVKQVKFKSSERLGRVYFQPVVLSQEQGFTYADEDDGLFDLNDSISLTSKHAEVPSQQILGRSAISMKEAAVAVKGNSVQSFVNATEFRVKNLLDSAARRLEVAMLYGRSATGLARAVTGTTASATQFRFDIPASQWASGIWAGADNVSLECYNDTGTQVGTGSVSVYNVDMENKYVYVTGASADISDIDTAIGTGIVLRYKSANSKEMYGLDSIILNTGSLFNISASTYALWKGNTSSASSGALTMGKLLKALNAPIGKGLRDDVVVLVAPETFANLNEDEAALRMFDSSYKPEKAERGNKKISYYYQHGKMDIVSHNMVKGGEAFCLPLDIIRRVGATDLTFRIPGMDDKMFRLLESKAGFEFRIYADQSIFLMKPGHAVKITSIVNS